MKTILPSILIFVSALAQAQTAWAPDPSHSKIQFITEYMMMSDIPGEFREYEITMVSEQEDFTGSQISFKAKVASISTDNEKRDAHLRSPDFFDAEKYPEIIFTGASFTKVEGDLYKLAGNLTIRDITHPVELDVIYRGTTKDPWGNTRAAFQIKGEISRSAWGLEWNVALEAGGWLVGDKVRLVCDVMMIRK